MHLFTTEELIELIDSGIPQIERAKIVESLESLLDEEVISDIYKACQQRSRDLAKSIEIKLFNKALSSMDQDLLNSCVHLGEQKTMIWADLFKDYLEMWMQIVTCT